MNSTIFRFLLVALSAIPMTGHAGLVGQELSASYQYPDVNTTYGAGSFTPATFTVGAGQESAGDIEGVTTLNIDFDDDSLTISLDTILNSPTWNGASFNGIVFTASLPHGITNAVVDAATTMAGFDSSRAYFDADEIFVNWQGLSYVNGTVVKINFAFEAGSIPTPGSLSLLGLGLLGLGVARRRKLRDALLHRSPAAAGRISSWDNELVRGAGRS